MKVLTRKLFFILFLGAGMMLTTQSCDDCRDVTCENGGTCDEGDCTCTTGYIGDNCETEDRAKYIGSWSGADGCSVSGAANFTATISASSASVTTVLISGFWGAGFNNPITATINGNNITIAEQDPDSDGFTVTGTGTLSGNTITWNFTVTDTDNGVTDVCTSTYTSA